MGLSRRELLATLAVFGGLFVVATLLEPRLFAFERGSHFSWVPLHSLAIADHSTAGTGWVGYSCLLSRIAENGVVAQRHDYFDRYPVFFSALSGALLRPLRVNSEFYLYAAKTWMNFIYVATLGFLFLAFRSLGLRSLAAGLGLVAAGTSPLWLHYRPMYHFDQAGLLGFSLAFWAWAAFVRAPARRGAPARLLPFLALAIAGCLFGRPFFTVFFLLSAALVPLIRGAKRGVWRPPLLAGLVGGGLQVLAAAYAGVVEVLLRGGDVLTGLATTPVFQSARRRLGLPTETWGESQADKLDLPEMSREILEWLLNLVPSWPLLPLAAVGLLLLLRSLMADRAGGPRSRAADPGASPPPLPLDAWVMVLLASAAWLVLFRNLIVFHDYTVIFLVPALALGAALLVEALLRDLPAWSLPRWCRRALLGLLALALVQGYVTGYQASLKAWTVPGEHRAPLRRFHREIDAFNARGSDGERPLVARDRQWIPGSPYAQCLLLEADLGAGPGLGDRQIAAVPPFPLDADAMGDGKRRSRRRLPRGSLRPLLGDPQR